MEVKGRIILVEGDITKENVDAIVNAANSSLMGGGGVDGAIHRAAGPKLLEECKKIRRELFPNGLPTGEAVLTNGYNLKAIYVIHTVGPIYGGGYNNEAELLAKCYRNCLKLAKEKGLKSISFPAISTGAYGYPLEEAAEIAISEIVNFLKENNVPDMVHFVVIGENAEIYRRKLKEKGLI
ncbi:MAG: O-acetyl-ADP-ribose deacetylase [Candidatus Marinimicrobia bacterium]|nr:O-acetyl-ADP-ribose deacetylase [Candidatus Neomarinimicrobiota bacterium]